MIALFLSHAGDLLLLVANHSEQGAAEPESGNEKRL